MNSVSPRSATEYGLKMTAAAARRINMVATEQNQSTLLRLTIEGGGCSGFQYKFDLDDSRKPDDLVLERDGATLVVDEMSLSLLQNSEIDWVESLAGAMFVLNNPNATSMCGCGTSFSIG